jgi:cold shock CspA family protein
MRFEGTLVRWDDVRGIGTIESSQGGEPLFVHISALPIVGGRPRQGERFSFEIEPNPRGGKQAVRGRKLPPVGRPVLVPVGETKWSDAPPRATPAAGHPNRRAAVRPRFQAPHEPRTSGLRRWVGTVMVLASVAIVSTVALHSRSSRTPADLNALPATSAGPAAVPMQAPAPKSTPVDYSTPQVTYRCDGRLHCSQMRSCNEARYFLANCPGVKMDGDGDGIPCEEQLCGH